MTDQEIGNLLYEEALRFVNRRFPRGWGGCAAMMTEQGKLLLSVALESFNGSAGLCMETGAMCQAQKENLKITHTLCISRDAPGDTPVILTPCGICQERLMYWGKGVKAAVTNPGNRILFRTLEALAPCHWADAFPEEEQEHSFV